MRETEIHALLTDRCENALRQTHLVVDYYRIRRKLALPLPVRQITIHRHPLKLPPEGYPWATWMSWALEDRLHTLGWSAHWLDHDEAGDRVAEELRALAQWPQYNQYPKPDLSTGHAVRTMLTALRHWDWLDETTQTAMREGCTRAIAQLIDWYDHDRPGIMPDDSQRPILHNIPIIGTLVLAAAARYLDHPQHESLHRQARTIVEHLLEQRAKQGFNEGVAYDGYVLDFIGDWLEGEPAEVRRAVLQHTEIDGWVNQSLTLGAPGEVLSVAPIGDVEPYDMPFHITALAKVARFEPRGDVCWLLREAPLEPLRTETLAHMHRIEDVGEWQPPTGALAGHYATVLRTGVEAEDVAAIVSTSRSTMGHSHPDAGSIVLGHCGRWWIDDPGYQQYMPTSEREFSIGPAAHNCPRIAGVAQTQRGAARLLRREQVDEQTSHATIDMTAGYELDTLERAVRHLWLVGREALVVADEIVLTAGAEPITELIWHWHGHPDLAWHVEPAHALLYHDASHLWLSAPQMQLDESMVQRQRGSRGQLTLIAPRTVETLQSTTWWLFQFNATPAAPAEVDATQCRWLDRTFHVHPT